MATYAGKPCKRGHDGTRYVGGTKNCVECNRASAAAFRLANPERVKAGKVASVKANPERAKARVAAWWKANPERGRASKAAWRKANPEKNRATKSAWAKANPEKCRAYQAARRKANPRANAAMTARRKAMKLAAPGRGVTAAQWRQVLGDSLGLCVYCGERRVLTMDHIEPLAKGGAHDVDNIVATCKPCNCSKNNRSLLVWLAMRLAW